MGHTSCAGCAGRGDGDDDGDSAAAAAKLIADSAELVANLKAQGWAPGSPIVLIPGLTCTALTVEESTARPDWVDANIWLDLAKITLSAVVTTGDERSAEADKAASLLAEIDADGDGEVTPDEIAAFVRNISELRSDGDAEALLAQLKGATASAARAMFWKATALQSKLKAIMLERSFSVGGKKVDVPQALSVAGVRNGWVQHLSLVDGYKDPEGIRVRPVTTNSGLDGCDFISKSPLLRSITYIYGPLIKSLEEFGYTAGSNLSAAPYDWRLSPSKLQERDKYYSNLMDLVEKMYAGNGDKPVVLVAHSMGCRQAHYFCHWVAHADEGKARGGAAWSEKHVGSVITIGGPFLGAPEANRSTFVGMDMLPRALVSEQHAFELGRNFSSNPMLYALHRLHGARAGASGDPPRQQSTLWVRREGVLKVHLVSCHLPKGAGTASFEEGGSGLARSADEAEAEFTTMCVAVLDGVKGGQQEGPAQEKQILTSRPKNSHTPAYDDHFQFVVGSPGDASMLEDATLTLTLRNITGRFSVCPVTKKVALLPMPPIIAKKTFKLATLVGGQAGKSVDLADQPFVDDDEDGEDGEDGKDGKDGEDGEHGKDEGSKKGEAEQGETGRDDQQATITMSLTWLPHEDDVRTGCRGRGFLREDVEGVDGLGGATAAGTAATASTAGTAGTAGTAAAAAAADGGDQPTEKEPRPAASCWIPVPGDGAPPSTTYAPREMDELLYEDDAEATYKMWMRDFADDPVFAGGRTAQKPPGIRKLVNIYGTNLDTEIGSVYRRTPKRYDFDNRLETSFEIDVECAVDNTAGFRCTAGRVFETRHTQQKDEGTAKKKTSSGDGTVPYWSCRYPEKWMDGTASSSSSNGDIANDASGEAPPAEEEEEEEKEKEKGGNDEETKQQAGGAVLQVETIEIDKAVHRDILKHPQLTDTLLRHVGTSNLDD